MRIYEQNLPVPELCSFCPLWTQGEGRGGRRGGEETLAMMGDPWVVSRGSQRSPEVQFGRARVG